MALIWTIGSIASIVALVLVVLDTDWIFKIKHEEDQLMNELEGTQDTNLPLHVLAKRDNVVFIVVDRALADAMRDWSAPMRLRIKRDRFDSRIRHMDLQPASDWQPSRQHRHPRHRDRQLSPPEVS